MAENRHFSFLLTIISYDMGMADNDDHKPSGVDFVEIDTATYVAAKIFGAVALPSGTPSAKAAFIEAAANAATILDGAENFVMGAGGAGGPLNDQTRAERQRKNDDDNLDYLISIGERAQEEREREEWMRTRSTVAGVTMTGAEWAQLADRLRTDSGLKEEILAAFRKRGMTDEEADRRYERVADVAAIAAKPPSQRTEQEVETFEKAKGDPSFRQDLNEARSLDSAHTAAAPSATVKADISPRSEPIKLVAVEVAGPSF